MDGEPVSKREGSGPGIKGSGTILVDTSQVEIPTPGEAFLGSIWDTVKLWDDDVGEERFDQLRESGYGGLSSDAVAVGSQIGEKFGIGLIEDARSGRGAEGDQLSFWPDIWR